MVYSRFQRLFSIGLLFCLVSIGCNRSEQPVAESADSSDPDSVMFEMVATDSISPLELLLETHQVEYRSSLMGSFVTEIDTVKNSSSAFWVYSVNDTTPTIACDKMTLVAGDTLRWHLRRVNSSVDPETNK